MTNEKDRQLYFVAWVPEPELFSDLEKIKREVSNQFDTYHALKSPPHITLHMPFKWPEDKEGKLINALSEVSSKEFEIELDGFAVFPPRVLYVNVSQNQPIYELFVAIQKKLRSLKIDNASYKNQGFTPHITLAHRDFKRQAFNAAWEIFRNKKFNATPLAKGFSLLKHTGTRWMVYRNFSFPERS